MTPDVEEYLSRPPLEQWSLRVVLIWIASGTEDGDIHFWLEIADKTTKLVDDPQDDKIKIEDFP